MLANFLSESDMMEWADTIIACTGDYMAGAYVGTPSQKPWESPLLWASTDQYLVMQVKEWFSTIATRTGGVVDPIIKIFLEDYEATAPGATTNGLADSAPPSSRQTQSPSWCPL
jgi:hypothetical protein